MSRPFAFAISLLVFSLSIGAEELRVKHADVPQYPPLAIAARLSGMVRFHVTVQAGAVTSVTPDGRNSPRLRILEAAALENIRGWSFYGGTDAFDVEFTYELSPQEALLPHNPRIELALPHSVRLIAVPVKRTVNYEQRR